MVVLTDDGFHFYNLRNESIKGKIQPATVHSLYSAICSLNRFPHLLGFHQYRIAIQKHIIETFLHGHFALTLTANALEVPIMRYICADRLCIRAKQINFNMNRLWERCERLIMLDVQWHQIVFAWNALHLNVNGRGYCSLGQTLDATYVLIHEH